MLLQTSRLSNKELKMQSVHFNHNNKLERWLLDKLNSMVARFTVDSECKRRGARKQDKATRSAGSQRRVLKLLMKPAINFNYIYLTNYRVFSAVRCCINVIAQVQFVISH